MGLIQLCHHWNSGKYSRKGIISLLFGMDCCLALFLLYWLGVCFFSFGRFSDLLNRVKDLLCLQRFKAKSKGLKS